MHLTPQGLIYKEGNSDQLVFYDSFLETSSSTYINTFASTKDEIELHYSPTMMRYLVRMRDILISCPDKENSALRRQQFRRISTREVPCTSNCSFRLLRRLHSLRAYQIDIRSKRQTTHLGKFCSISLQNSRIFAIFPRSL